MPETPATHPDSRASAGLPVRIMEAVDVCAGRDDGGAVCAGEENGLFGLEVRETWRVVRGGGDVRGADYGYQSRTECVYEEWGPEPCLCMVWFGLWEVLRFAVSGLWEEMPFVRVGSWRVGTCGDVRAGGEARTSSEGSQSFIDGRVSMSDLVMVRVFMVGFGYICLMSGRSFFREVVWHFGC